MRRLSRLAARRGLLPLESAGTLYGSLWLAVTLLFLHAETARADWSKAFHRQ